MKPNDSFDFQVAAGSLGRFLRRSLSDFPKHDGYLKADAEKSRHLRKRYEAIAAGRPIVGLAWKSAHKVYGQSKSTSPSELRPVLTASDVLFVNLQYGDCAEDIAAAERMFGVKIHHDPAVDALADMDGFLAQVAAMDLVITTSNSAAHVAGALNTPTWLLLPRGRGALWYWFLQRDDSPWYPSMRIIRARVTPAPGQPWVTDVAERVGTALAHWASRRAA